MSIEEFYNDIKKNAKNNTTLNQLYKRPQPDKKTQTPKFKVYGNEYMYQADTLYMPEDKGYKFILVVVDIYDNSMDAEPMKNVDADNALNAFQNIFKRKYLKPPYILTMDKGKEFNHEKIKAYFKKLRVKIRYTETARHRQNAVVERMNLIIGQILFKRQVSQELITGETSKEWVDDLPDLVKVLNKKQNKKKPIEPETDLNDLDNYIDKDNGKLLNIGQKVRYKLDYPINTTNNARLYGEFRATDIRWSPKIYEIIEIQIVPNNPPMYIINDDKYIARTKAQLSIVKKNELQPDARFNRGENNNEEFGIVDKIIDYKQENNKDYYLIKWSGRNIPNSWVHTSVLNRTQILKEMKKKYRVDNFI